MRFKTNPKGKCAHLLRINSIAQWMSLTKTSLVILKPVFLCLIVRVVLLARLVHLSWETRKTSPKKNSRACLMCQMSYVFTDSYNSVRFSMARKSVTSSAYWYLLPRLDLVLGETWYQLVWGDERYIDVASPSAVALVATITSETSLFMRRVMRLLRLISSGLMPFIGEMSPCKTW